MPNATIYEKLCSMQDEKFQAFQSKLIPTVEPDKIIGVRTPALRAFAKQFQGTEEAEKFLSHLPHTYFEENNLHAFILSGMKDFSACAAAVDRFLPYVDNWATCDQMSPKVFKKNKNELLKYIEKWLASEHTYAVRYGINMLMFHFLDEAFKEEYMYKVASVNSDDYYIKMSVAWYFATALAKQYDSAVHIIENNILEPWTHNKAIQKAIESYRISTEIKDYLRNLKRKTKK